MSYATGNVLEFITQNQFDELASSPSRPLPVDRVDGEEAEEEEPDSDGDLSVFSGSAVEVEPKLEEAEEPLVKPAKRSRPRASLSPRAKAERTLFNEIWAQLKPLKGDPAFFDSFSFFFRPAD
jgi:hypothetical protein